MEDEATEVRRHLCELVTRSGAALQKIFFRTEALEADFSLIEAERPSLLFQQGEHLIEPHEPTQLQILVIRIGCRLSVKLGLDSHSGRR